MEERGKTWELPVPHHVGKHEVVEGAGHGSQKSLKLSKVTTGNKVSDLDPESLGFSVFA